MNHSSIPPIEFFWEKAGFTPNSSQKEAILHPEGPLFLTAGPGSGKTRVLLWRTLNLLVYHGVNPDEIFLSTFTEKAALQLKDGLRSILGFITNATGKPYDISGMSIGTVHSICQSLLTDRRFSEDHHRRRAPILIDDLAQYFKIYNRKFWRELLLAGGHDDEEAGQRAINQYLIGKDIYSRHVAVTNCISFFNRLSEENIDPETIRTKNSDLQTLLRMYAKYKEGLSVDEKIHQVDFSLLQQKAYDAFRVFERSGYVFKHIIIDEYQDTNSIQELIFFELARGHKNICVVGDDDQALYRFRGATVENLVEFEDRCTQHLEVKPRRIDLNINYRSRKNIVDLYTSFIDQIDWADAKQKSKYYRIVDKKIKAHSKDDHPSVVVSAKAKGEEVYAEVARFVKLLYYQGKISDYNQVAFLFPSMKSMGSMNTRVRGYQVALEAEGIPFYSPRAGRFLEVEESVAIFGLFQKIFGSPKHHYRGQSTQGMRDFQEWMRGCDIRADELIKNDKHLKEYVNDRVKEIETVTNDYQILLEHCDKKKINLKSPFKPGMSQTFAGISGLSLRAQKHFSSHYFNQAVKRRLVENDPYRVSYVLNRVTSVDWSILDLFYQLNGFEYFRGMYKLAEKGLDEGPVCNLGLITQYLARFMDDSSPVITGSFLIENRFVNRFFSSYLYAIFRLGESEYEYSDDPFPKGRVPFLTIHQAKGLEFPIVVLGSVYKEDKEAPVIETIIRKIKKKEGEPLDRIGQFDNMRMFYVALSRAKNLLILPRYTHNKNASEQFKNIFENDDLTELSAFDLKKLPVSVSHDEELGKSYSYTGDFLLYNKCPRNYMLFKKYGFVPSRSQTMFFGRLVHQTIEDLHHHVMNQHEHEAHRHV
jgi:DNA helicase-2/ATP-dependent DNA helicase PcrA